MLYILSVVISRGKYYDGAKIYKKLNTLQHKVLKFRNNFWNHQAMITNDIHKEGRYSSDADIIRSIANGRLDAFNVIIDRYLDLVSRTSYLILCDRAASNEVTRSVFGWIWKKSSSYDEILSVEDWIYRITCSFCHVRLRRRRLLDYMAFQSDVYEKSAPEAFSQEEEYMTKEAWVIFCRASWELSSEQRIVYVLCELEGISVREAAVITGRYFEVTQNDLRTARNGVKRELEIYGKVR